MERKPVKHLFTAVLVAAGLASAAVPVGAQTRPAPVELDKREKHCVVIAESVDKDGVLVTGAETCFATEREADSFYVQLVEEDDTVKPQQRFSARSGSTTIGKHYTSTNYGGSSIRIVGTTCGGGVWWPTGYWNNNIESSRHYCGGSATTFYDSSNCASGVYPIWSKSPNLGWMKNKASCVRYG